MKIFFPVSAANHMQAAKVLAWADHLKTRIGDDDTFVVLHEEGAFDPTEVINRAKCIAMHVKHRAYEVPEQCEYPLGKNVPWQSSAWWMNENDPNGLWFYWEPDAIPLKRGWFEKIKECAKSGRITGCVLSQGMIDGVAVYPGDVMNIWPQINLCRQAPFDQIGGPRGWLDIADHTDLFQVRWTIDGMTPTFNSQAEVAAVLDKDAVMFHRNKDCTLIDHLAPKRSVFKKLFSSGKRSKAGSQKVTDQTCIIMLGRYGDVINALPVARGLSKETNTIIPFIVHKKYADVLEGCSYVDPVIWKGEWIDVNGAIEFAKSKNFGEIRVAQVNGRNFGIETKCDSFAAEGWRQMGVLGKWTKWGLEFDKRNSDREAELCAKWIKRDKKNILINLHGISSPAPWADDLKRSIQSAWGRQANIVDLQEVKAHRIFDLLGLYDKADLLITIDTATLHLAYASSVKSIQFIVDTPTIWHGARPRGNVVLHMRYFDVPHRTEEIQEAIRVALTHRRQAQLIHAFSSYEPSAKDEKRRYKVAAEVRETVYEDGGWVPMPIQDCVLPRLFEDGKRKLPYVKDLIDHAVSGASADDVLVFTNIDICFVPSIKRRIWDAMNAVDACYCFRRDFRHLSGPMTQEAVDRADLYPGSDLYAFRVSWWKTHGHKMPDMLLAAEAWDWCLRLLIDETHVGLPVSYKNWIYHERHDSMWERNENRLTLPSQIHNIKLAAPFLEKRGIRVPTHFQTALKNA